MEIIVALFSFSNLSEPSKVESQFVCHTTERELVSGVGCGGEGGAEVTHCGGWQQLHVCPVAYCFNMHCD